MKWKSNLNQRYNTGLALVVLLIIMLTLIFTHRRNVSELHDSLSSIFADRLIALDLLHDISDVINEKKAFFDSHDHLLHTQTTIANDTIQALINKYKNTKLTTEESELLFTIKDHIQKTQVYENKLTQQIPSTQLEGIRPELANHYNLILSDLDNLTKLQLQEGQKLTHQSNRIVASENITFRLAIGLFLIIIVLIFKIYSSSPRKIVYPSLN